LASFATVGEQAIPPRLSPGNIGAGTFHPKALAPVPLRTTFAARMALGGNEKEGGRMPVVPRTGPPAFRVSLATAPSIYVG